VRVMVAESPTLVSSQLRLSMLFMGAMIAASDLSDLVEGISKIVVVVSVNVQ